MESAELLSSQGYEAHGWVVNITDKEAVDKVFGEIREVYGRIYAYETDGFGNYNLMDDANSPSLFAAPYLGYCSKDDEIYQKYTLMLLQVLHFLILQQFQDRLRVNHIRFDQQ